MYDHVSVKRLLLIMSNLVFICSVLTRKCSGLRDIMNSLPTFSYLPIYCLTFHYSLINKYFHVIVFLFSTSSKHFSLRSWDSLDNLFSIFSSWWKWAAFFSNGTFQWSRLLFFQINFHDSHYQYCFRSRLHFI